MCGRFIASPYSWQELFTRHRDFLNGLDMPMGADDEDGIIDSFNVKPTQRIQMACVANGALTGSSARWWFVPHWHKGPASDWKATTFNAKIETAFEKPTFRTAWDKGRCIIPALGYYEWTGTKGKKEPWHITVGHNAPVFFFAGLWSPLADGTRSCAILTRPAAKDIAALHPRMPVILTSDEIAGWLGHATPNSALIANLGTGWDGRHSFHRVARLAVYCCVGNSALA